MSKTKIIFATNNPNKIRELREILESRFKDRFIILSLKEANVRLSVDENQDTYEKNAMIKARAVREQIKDALIVADDSGIEIDAIKNELGIHSARFMGEDTPYDIKNRAILDRLKDIDDSDRVARFVCALAVIYPDGHSDTLRGVWEGRIAHEISGENGFGYDPIFYLDEYKCTSAQLSENEKNKISHRGLAMQKMLELEFFKAL